MGTEADIVIVGGGVMGLFLAVHLRRLGVAEITLIEKRFCGAGSSGKSGAICRQHYSNEVTAGLARDSLERFSHFAIEFGNDGGFRRTGCLFFAPDDQREMMQKNVELQQSWGINTFMIDLAQAEAIEPRFDLSDDPAVCFEPDSGYCDPLLVLSALETASAALDIQLIIGRRAVSLARNGGGIRGVELDDGEFLGARTVVNCAGPWAAQLAATAEIRLPIRATRPQIAFTRRPIDSGGPMRQHPIVADLAHTYYARPDQPGLTLIGGLDMEQDPLIENPDDEDEGIDSLIVRELNERLARRFPAMQRARSQGGMGALYACTPDYHPIIGPQPECENLYTCAGFSGHGFKMSPEIGRELAHRIVHGAYLTHDLEIFRPQRFEQNQPVRGRYEYSILG